MTGEGDPEDTAEHREIGRPSSRVYVASLTDYNAGVLHGTWLDAATTVAELEGAIGRMLAESPVARRYGELAEEWAIHDYEGFGPVQLSEWEPLRSVSVLAQGMVDHGEPFAAWWRLSELDLSGTELTAGDDEELLYECTRRFEDQYRGEFDSLTAYCEEFVNDAFGLDLDNLPGIPASLAGYITIDAERLARDMVAEGTVSVIAGSSGVYVFDLAY